MTLNHKRILIIGGTKGIGRAAVTEMLTPGDKILFTDRKQRKVASIKQELVDSGLTQPGGQL